MTGLDGVGQMVRVHGHTQRPAHHGHQQPRRHDCPDRDERNHQEFPPPARLEGVDSDGDEDGQEHEGDQEVDPQRDATDGRWHVALLAPPHEGFVELMSTEHEWERSQGHVVPPSVDMTDDIDPDSADGKAAHQVGLGREAHVWLPTCPGKSVGARGVARNCHGALRARLAPRPSGGAERSVAELSERSMTALATSLKGIRLVRE